MHLVNYWQFNIWLLDHDIAKKGYWMNLLRYSRIASKKIKFKVLRVNNLNVKINFPDNLIVFSNSDYDKKPVQQYLEEFDI